MKSATLLLFVSWTIIQGHSETLSIVSREAYLMGTRAQLSVYTADRSQGLSKLGVALKALEDTEEELSTWRDTSEISALNRHPVGAAWIAPPQLCRMLVDVWLWHRETGGTFDPGIGNVLSAWDIHGDGAIPDGAQLARARATSGLRRLAFDQSSCTLTKQADVALDVGAFGKGEALDRAASVLGTTPWMIDLGGQVSVGGDAPPDGAWTVAIAHPHHRSMPVLHVRMNTGSLSTSAGSERDLVVNGVRVGHHIDPRTGYPVAFDGSVIVWHRSGLAADALSTGLFVMGPEEGLRWARPRGIAVAYVMPNGAAVRVDATKPFRELIIGRE